MREFRLEVPAVLLFEIILVGHQHSVRRRPAQGRGIGIDQFVNVGNHVGKGLEFVADDAHRVLHTNAVEHVIEPQLVGVDDNVVAVAFQDLHAFAQGQNILENRRLAAGEEADELEAEGGVHPVLRVVAQLESRQADGAPQVIERKAMAGRFMQGGTHQVVDVDRRVRIYRRHEGLGDLAALGAQQQIAAVERTQDRHELAGQHVTPHIVADLQRLAEVDVDVGVAQEQIAFNLQDVLDSVGDLLAVRARDKRELEVLFATGLYLYI